MNASPTLTRSRGIRVAIASALSSLIGIGILAAVTDLFQSRGEAMGQLAAGERAYAGRIYVSEREACMREWIAALQPHRLAN